MPTTQLSPADKRATLARMRRMFALALRVFGSGPDAKAWLLSPVKELHYYAPATILISDAGEARVKALLESF